MIEGSHSDESNNQDEPLDLEKVLAEEIGEGRYQVNAIALCGVIAFLTGLTLNDFIFFAERVKTRCKIQECENTDQSSFTPPWLEDAVPALGQTVDSCHRFAPSDSWNVSADSCHPAMFDKSSIVACTEYVYEHHNSAVYEFGLACDEWRWFLFGSSSVFGLMLSLPLTGFIADRWGRRFALSLAAFCFTCVSVTRYWVHSYTVFIFIGFSGSVLGSGCMAVCCYSSAIELVSSKRRMAVCSTISSCVTAGSVVKGLIASTQPYWRNLLLILYLPMLISIGYFWIAPESIRWLMSKNRFEEAKVQLMKAANTNGRVLSDKTAKKLTECNMKSKADSKDSEVNFVCLLFKHKTVILRGIIISVWLFSSSLIVKGITISSVSISGNRYVNFCAVAGINIPALWIGTFLNNKIGRKPLLIGLFWMGGSCQLAYIFVPKGIPWINLALYMLAKFCAAAVSVTIIVYSAEVFPTSHRSRLTGITSMFGRLGGLIALLTPAMADRLWEHLPQILFSVMAYLSSLLGFLIPETLGAPLPQSMEDAAQLGKDQISWTTGLLSRFTIKKKPVKCESDSRTEGSVQTRQ